MKSIWNGTVSFGLVTIPVRMYSAIEKHTLGFKMLHDKCQTPITYKRWCDHCNKEVSWEQIVKGLKVGHDKYFILTKEKIKELRPHKTDNVDVLEFVDFEAVSIIYFDSHYYLAPDKKGEKAYYLFLEALKKTGKAAVGRFVMKDKEYLCLLTPYENGLLITTLNYEYEVRDLYKIPELSKREPKISKTELDLAVKLINQASKKKFDISKYKDTFAVELAKAIKKGKTKAVSVRPERSRRVRAKNTLIGELKNSIQHPEKRAIKRVKAKR